MTDESHIRTAERHRIAEWLEERAAKILQQGKAHDIGMIYAVVEAAALKRAAADLRKMDT